MAIGSIFRIAVARSNPLIFRRVALPPGAACADLLALVPIALGLEEGKARLSLESGAPTDERGDVYSEEGELIDGKALLLTAVRQGEHLRVELSADGTSRKDRARIRLDLYAETVAGEAGAAAAPADEEHDLPVVLTAVGYDLPQGVWDIGAVNRVQQEIEIQDSCTTAEGLYFNRQALAYSERKTGNAIRRHFAPDTAIREVNRSLGMPLSLLLEKRKLPDLKNMAEIYRIYTYTTTRKADLIGAFCEKYDRGYLEDFFEELSVEEFMHFRRFVLSDRPEETSDDWLELLDSFYDRGLLSDVSKVGLRMATEVLSYYEEWYATDAETLFVRSKYMKNAALAAGRLYGIFDRAQFGAVLEQIAPEQIPAETVDAYYRELESGRCQGVPVRALREDVVYYEEELKTAEALKLLEQQLRGDGRYRLPAAKELLKLAKKGVGFGKANESKLKTLIKENSYLYYYGYHSNHENVMQKACERIASRLHIAGDVEETMKIVRAEMDRVNWDGRREKALGQARKILEEELPHLPLIALNGYAKENCPGELLLHFEEQERQEKQRKEKQAAAAQRRMMATKKAAAGKIRRPR